MRLYFADETRSPRKFKLYELHGYNYFYNVHEKTWIILRDGIEVDNGHSRGDCVIQILELKERGQTA